MRLNQRINHGEIVGYYPVLRDMCELVGESDQYTHLPSLATLWSVSGFSTHIYTATHKSTLHWVLHTFVGKS